MKSSHRLGFALSTAALSWFLGGCAQNEFATLCDLHPEQCCDLNPELEVCRDGSTGETGVEAGPDTGTEAEVGEEVGDSGDADVAPDAPDGETETGGPICTKDEVRCTGATLEQCSSDGMMWLTVATCPSAETCDAKAGRCTACTPDAIRCDGTKRKQCDKFGKAELEVATCDTLELCLAGTGTTCAKAACAAGEKKCEGATAKVCNAGRTGFDSTPCVSAGLCSGGVCATPACAVGEKRCSGTSAQTCNADRTGWDTTATCATSALCSAGACTTPACAVGEKKCVGAAAQICNADRTGFDTTATCASASLCSAGTCSGAVCAVGEKKCVGALAMVCNAARTGFDTVSNCGTAALCSAGVCSTATCAVGEKRCSGTSAQVCNADRTGWDTTATCATSALCSAGACSTAVCAVGEKRCSGTAAQVCNAGRTGWDTSATCLTAGLCSAGVCATPACAAGDKRCSGALAQTCNAERTGWDTVTTCASAALCGAGVCTTPTCASGDKRCSGTSAQTCNTDLTGWTTTATCVTSALCSAGACSPPVCAAGAKQCSGTSAQTCNAGQTGWDTTATCATAALCSAGVCSPPACAATDKRCVGTAAQSCNADRTGYVTTDTCATAALCSVGVCTAPACGAAEKRCLGKKVQTCNADRTAFADTETCAIDCDGGAAAACLKVTQLAGGEDHTCVLLSNKTVRCWGSNGGWQALGAAGAALRPTVVSGVSNVTRLAANRMVTAALRGDGSILWWGMPLVAPTAIAPTVVSLGVSATPSDLAIAPTHLCIRDADGYVKCLGNNDAGNLGNGTKIAATSLVVASGTSGNGPISLGQNVSFSVSSATESRGWGFNGNGLLGDASAMERPTPVSTYGGALEIRVSPDANFSCGRFGSGIVKCAGQTSFLGPAMYTAPTPIAGLSNTTQLAASSVAACALASDGSVRCWGEPPLGDGGGGMSASPVLATIGGTARAVVIGSPYGCVLMSDETTVKCWGANSMLGIDSDVGNTFTPTPVIW